MWTSLELLMFSCRKINSNLLVSNFVSKWVYRCKCVCMCVCMYVCMYEWMNECMYMHVYACICMYIFIYIIYIYIIYTIYTVYNVQTLVSQCFDLFGHQQKKTKRIELRCGSKLDALKDVGRESVLLQICTWFFIHFKHGRSHWLVGRRSKFYIF